MRRRTPEPHIVWRGSVGPCGVANGSAGLCRTFPPVLALEGDGRHRLSQMAMDSAALASWIARSFAKRSKDRRSIVVRNAPPKLSERDTWLATAVKNAGGTLYASDSSCAAGDGVGIITKAIPLVIVSTVNEFEHSACEERTECDNDRAPTRHLLGLDMPRMHHGAASGSSRCGGEINVGVRNARP